MIQAIAIIGSGILFSWGGYNWHNARRFIMPCLLAGCCFWLTKSLWPLTMLSSMLFLCLGYGINAPLRHIFGDGWGRSVWGLLVALSLSLGLFMAHFIGLWWFLGYLALGFTLENALKKVYQIAGDFLIGCGFGLVCLVVQLSVMKH